MTSNYGKYIFDRFQYIHSIQTNLTAIMMKISHRDLNIPIDNSDVRLATERSTLTEFRSADARKLSSKLDKEIRLKPHNANAYNRRGLAKYELADLPGAIADFNLAIELNPVMGIFYNNRGLVRLDLGDRPGATADFDYAIAMNPSLAVAHRNRGRMRYQSRDKKGAIMDLNRAIQIDPQCPKSGNLHGMPVACWREAIGVEIGMRVKPQHTQLFAHLPAMARHRADRTDAQAVVAPQKNRQVARAQTLVHGLMHPTVPGGDFCQVAVAIDRRQPGVGRTCKITQVRHGQPVAL